MNRYKYFIFTEESVCTFTYTNLNTIFTTITKRTPLPNTRALYDDLTSSWFVAESTKASVPLRYISTEDLPAILKAYLLLNPV